MAYIGIPGNPAGVTDWVLVPGVVKTGGADFGEFNAWFSTNATIYAFVIRRETLGTSGALTAPVRILVIPANDLRTGRQAAVDFSDYNAVKKFYNLPD